MIPQIRSVADPTLCVDSKFKNDNERFNLAPCIKDSIGRSGEQVIINRAVAVAEEITYFFIIFFFSLLSPAAFFIDMAQRHQAQKTHRLLGRTQPRGPIARPLMGLSRIERQPTLALRSGIYYSTSLRLRLFHVVRLL